MHSVSVVRALNSHTALATQVLNTDKHGMMALGSIVYELLPVVEDGHLVGIIGKEDILRTLVNHSS